MSQKETLSDSRQRILEAATDRILPSEDGPGAATTGVTTYISSTLAEEELQPVRPLIEKGLDLLDGLAREHHGQPFAVCSEHEQDDVLERLEDLGEPWPHLFLRHLVFLSLEGFLCDPRRGGNRDGLGWRYTGYPWMPLETQTA